MNSDISQVLPIAFARAVTGRIADLGQQFFQLSVVDLRRDTKFSCFFAAFTHRVGHNVASYGSAVTSDFQRYSLARTFPNLLHQIFPQRDLLAIHRKNFVTGEQARALARATWCYARNDGLYRWLVRNQAHLFQEIPFQLIRADLASDPLAASLAANVSGFHSD